MASRIPNKKTQILALHGFTGCGEDFAEFSRLCGSNCAWMCPNLPGHGQTPLLACTPEATINFLTKQNPERPRILLGYSMGARAALLHAITYPNHWDALILISVNPGIEVESERTERALKDQTLAQKITAEGVPAFLQYWQRTPIICSQQQIRPDWRTTMRTNRLKHTAKGLAASLEQFGLAAYPNLWPQLSKLNCPILLITGEYDRKYCAFARRMQDMHPQAQWKCISKAGHMPHLEVPKESAATIRYFEHFLFHN